MTSLINVRGIDTMTACSWNSERTVPTTESSRGMGLPSGMPGLSSIQSSMHPSQKYPIKTLCFAKKSLMMPTKEEYSVLLGCGLGKIIRNIEIGWRVNLHLIR